MKVHIESRMVIYSDNVELPQTVAMASEVLDIPENPNLSDTANVLVSVQHNSEQLYQAFVAESKKLPSVLTGQQTQEVTRQGLMGLIAAMDNSKVKMLESFATRDTEDQTTWWCLKLAPVK